MKPIRTRPQLAEVLSGWKGLVALGAFLEGLRVLRSSKLFVGSVLEPVAVLLLRGSILLRVFLHQFRPENSVSVFIVVPPQQIPSLA
jgi:hypothetical protein